MHPFARPLVAPTPGTVGSFLSPILSQTDLTQAAVNVMKNQAGEVPEIQEALEAVKQAQNTNLAIPGFDQAEVQTAILEAIKTGQIDPKKIWGTVMGVGAGAICAATGAGLAVAPLCAAGGKLVGEWVAGLQAKPTAPNQETASSKALDATLESDWALLKAQREALYSKLAAQLSGDPQALSDMRQLLDDFFPFSIYDGIDKGFEYRVQMMRKPVGYGFLTPFVPECQVIGEKFVKECAYDFWEWEIDYSKPQLQGGWVEALLDRLAVDLVPKGIDVRPQVEEFKRLNVKDGRWWKGKDQPQAMLQVHQDMKTIFWPAMQLEFEKRMQQMLVKAAIRANTKLVVAVDKLGDALVARTGCTDEKCAAKLRQDAAGYAEKLRVQGVPEVTREIEKDLPTGSEKSGMGTGTKVVLGLAAVAAVYGGWRYLKKNKKR